MPRARVEAAARKATKAKAKAKAKAVKAKAAAAPAAFAVDWFTNNVPTWERFLVPRLAGRPTRALELGALEGRATLWMLERLLSHPQSSIVCLDRFSDDGGSVCSQGSPRRLGSVLASFRANVMRSPHAAKVSPIRGDPVLTLHAGHRLLRPASFDLVTIDPMGTARSALEAGVLVFPLLKPGGLIVFDDYTWSKEHDARCPRGGIDAFLSAYAADLRVIHYGWQVIAERRTTPLSSKPCYSEYYDEPRVGSKC